MSSLERLLAGVLLLVLLVIGGTLGVRWYGSSRYQAGVAAEREAQHGRELAATVRRVQDNALEASKQHSINLTVTETKNEELAPVRARILAAPGVRVGPALCGGAAPAAETASAQSGDGADSPGRMVRADLDRDIKALMLAVEEDLATGRACQAFVAANGLGTPPAPAAEEPPTKPEESTP